MDEIQPVVPTPRVSLPGRAVALGRRALRSPDARAVLYAAGAAALGIWAPQWLPFAKAALAVLAGGP